MSTVEKILIRSKKYWRFILFVIGIAAFFITLISIFAQSDPNTIKVFSYISLFSLGTVGLISFYNFFTGPSRQNHEISSSHAMLSISAFYGVFFPVIILAFVIQFLMLLNQESLTTSDISPFGNLFELVPGLIIGIGLIAISDHEIREKKLTYSLPGKKDSYLKSLIYSLPLVGLFFGIKLIVEFVTLIIFDSSALYTASSSPFSIDSGAIYAAKSWIFSSKLEKLLTPITFLLAYIALEVFLRGYISNLIRSIKLGPAAMIMIPAVIQAAAFSSGTLIFSDPILYLFRFFEAFLFGVLVGIALWKTKKFSVSLTIALLFRILDSSTEFFRVIMLSLPRGFGEYNLNDNVTTTAEGIASALIFIQIFLIVLTPFLIIVGYQEVWSILKTIWHNFKNQWFGYILIAVGFIMIDIIFSFIINGLGLGILILVGYFIAIFVIRYVLKALYSLLPAPTQPIITENQTGLLKSEYPVDILKDIKWLENEEPWHRKGKVFAIFAGFLFIYFMFISAAYRQYTVLEGLDIVKFTFFLILLPTIVLGLATYLLIDRYDKGYFFADSWRNQLFVGLLFLYFINILIWTKSGAIANFSWRNVPFFVFYAILIFPKNIETPFKSFSVGLSRDGRYATFRWILHKSDEFEEAYDKLITIPSNTIRLGMLIMATKLGFMEEWENIEKLRDDTLIKGEILGRLLALGMIGTVASEGILMNFIENEDIDIKIAAYWSLGKIGSNRVLSRMAQVIEENPRKDLLKVAENAILSIDPMYPLAGLRDNVIMV